MLVTENTKKGYVEYSRMTDEINNIKKLKTKVNEEKIELLVKNKQKELRDLMKVFLLKKIFH